MKKIVMIAVAGIVLGACVSARAGYRIDTTVTPGAEAHQYVVQFKIIDMGKDGKTEKILSMPTIAVKAETDGNCTIADEKKENVTVCTAHIKETEDGIEAVTTVIVKVQGAEQLNTSQTITVKK